MIENFGDIPPRPKFFEESDGATRFLIGSGVQGVKMRLSKGFATLKPHDFA